MQTPSTANQITVGYYSALASHSWSRHKVQKVIRQNGSMIYTTYHLVA
ncbi:hypothetical protein OTK49_21455 [Vibrio coralliirubri]|nr:hypothetical protein [Vibrio coralliirubri]MCY9865089.1 hypothetical protein [Vibrio coralliirubri]